MIGIILFINLICLCVLLEHVNRIWYFLKHGNKEINKDFRRYIK